MLDTLFSTHLPVLPVLLPLFTAVVLLLLGDSGGQASHGGAQLRRARTLSLASVVFGALLAWRLMLEAAGGALTVYPLGNWPAPFGIVLVVDRLSAMMLALTWTIAVPVLWYASGGWDAHGRYFHALFHFQLMGLSGAFVTGDLFNLFVFFEVLLIASYALMLHGQGRERLRVGVHYVVLNLGASVLFLMGVSLIYAVTGTLNLADLALRVPVIAGPQAAVLQAAGLILLVVFGFKAALMPLSMWLPATYAAASAPVAALFAIMTKVGVYAILRVHGIVFGADGSVPAGAAAAATAYSVTSVLLPVALLTSVAAVLGALAAHSLPRLVAWLTVVSVGTVLTAVGIQGPAAWSGALYYMAQSTLVIAGLFLLAELIGTQRGATGGRLDPAPPVAQPQMLGILLLLGAATVAGLPPLPGFIGKLMILEASALHAWVVPVWTVLLAAGFFTLVGLARAGSLLFWNASAAGVPEPAPRHKASAAPLLATLAPLALVAAMSVFAAPLMRYTDAAALQLADRAAYARAVLGSASEGALDTTRPYRVIPGARTP
ncbi:MAG: monovalent cation/H+ antiporter subunit D [Hydrogenophaga sp.]|uniref:monovalent cation/H+ antiporter subunit D n=1 Tax=Hydrogenophaga sp. TaxID=1904254 RepID=UPI002736EAC8|nr:monovalent cation/H+ antiporter subunit D [Hydrogenophaga sp.]MDP3628317.1 monovalent cation/H+ antiporter subunit D [Hydrogenophaga sp.]